ncbi:hypothetical protein ACFLRQ_02960 [Bacteroidota bacterium]
MKTKFISVLLICASLIYSCNKEENSCTIQEVRINNLTEMSFDSIIVRTARGNSYPDEFPDALVFINLHNNSISDYATTYNLDTYLEFIFMGEADTFKTKWTMPGNLMDPTIIPTAPSGTYAFTVFEIDSKSHEMLIGLTEFEARYYSCEN